MAGPKTYGLARQAHGRGKIQEGDFRALGGISRQTTPRNQCRGRCRTDVGRRVDPPACRNASAVQGPGSRDRLPLDTDSQFICELALQGSANVKPVNTPDESP